MLGIICFIGLILAMWCVSKVTDVLADDFIKYRDKQ